MQHVFLTGFMGSGKTSLGRAAAASLGTSFLDLDDEIEKQTGESIRELFAKGETHFRAREREILTRVLDATSGTAIIALGGGTWIQPEVQARVPASSVIFVDVPFELLASRVRNSARPLAADEQRFRELYQTRLPLYRTAGTTLKITQGEPPAESAKRLVHLIQQLKLE